MANVPDTVADLVRSELEFPAGFEDVLGRVGESFPDLEPLWTFLVLKDSQHRHAYYVKSEHVLFRRLGWRLMRPLFALALVAAVVSAFQQALDPTIALGLFLAGAASLYVVVQIFLHRWAWRDMKRLGSLDEDYRRKLSELLEALEGRK